VHSREKASAKQFPSAHYNPMGVPLQPELNVSLGASVLILLESLAELSLVCVVVWILAVPQRPIC
jgi:hypothetical protein